VASAAAAPRLCFFVVVCDVVVWSVLVVLLDGFALWSVLLAPLVPVVPVAAAPD
jgi:hypothetical protein